MRMADEDPTTRRIIRAMTEKDHEEVWSAIDDMQTKWNKAGFPSTLEDFMFRPMFTEKVAWSVPSKDAIELIIETVGERIMLSIGTGKGFWEALLEGGGVCVIATDIEVPPTPFFKGTYKDMDANTAVQEHPDADVLFINWPHEFAVSALLLFRGQFVVSIGEIDGCTGSVGSVLQESEEWNLVKQHEIPTWPTIHDILRIYKRV